MAIETDRSCAVCEHYLGCRGGCGGNEAGICPIFQPATNRHGDVDPETGDWAGQADDDRIDGGGGLRPGPGTAGP